NELGLDLRTCDYLLMINEMKFKTDVEVVQCTMDSTGIQALLLGEELNVSKIMESMSQTIARVGIPTHMCTMCVILAIWYYVCDTCLMGVLCV
ncbi:hypothetical protein SARC_17327, partial [Sphaeroforma arctica JP610]